MTCLLVLLAKIFPRLWGWEPVAKNGISHGLFRFLIKIIMENSSNENIKYITDIDLIAHVMSDHHLYVLAERVRRPKLITFFSFFFFVL